MASEITRRQLLHAGATGGAALAATSLASNPVLARALATPARCGKLTDIEHVVILMQENRSFDHYFGSYRGVAGFADPRVLKLSNGHGLTIFAQPGYPGGIDGGHLYPFHLDSQHNGECTNDITHDWGPQHRSFDGGAMDRFVIEHLAANGPVNGALTMGYYTRADLPFYYALADAFTICDRYYSAVIGPTDPNRLYSMSAKLGQDGSGGGPVLTTSSSRLDRAGTLSWTTMPEQLEARNVSWKVYALPDGNFLDNVLAYFKQYQQDANLAAKAFTPTFPGTFEADAAAGTLPQVSWVLTSTTDLEHPPDPVTYGECATAQVLQALTSNPALWAKTALFLTYDENGGFFDHVRPPVAPPGTPGEFLTVNPLPAAADGIAGPIGLGFRVPMLVISPFSRGGFVSSDTFDHTSILRFLETRFGAEVPNLSAWRRQTAGDLTTAFNFARIDDSVPTLPQPSRTDPRVVASDCPTNAPISFADEDAPVVQTYPVTVNSSAPAQEPGSAPKPSGPC